MNVSFVVKAVSIDKETASIALGRPPDRIHALGDFVSRSKTKTHDSNVYVYRISNATEADIVAKKMIEFVVDKSKDWEKVKDSYKYFDISIEKNGLVGDFSIPKELIEIMRGLDVQIEVDITRY